MRTGIGVRALVAVAMTSIPLVAIPLLAQEPEPAKTKVRKEADPARRLPNYFAKVGVSAEQRDEIYKIRRQHLEKIEALQQQIEEHETKMMAACEGVLTDAQRRLLEQYRDEAEKTKEKAKGKGKAKAKEKDA